jgi:5-methyltetrahydrofolate--homocysteine methyltransferase
MTPSVQWLSEQNELPILVMPNAGMPINENGKAKYLMTPKEITSKLFDFINKYSKIRLIGGCCGTSPEHISSLRFMLDDKTLTTNNQ